VPKLKKVLDVEWIDTSKALQVLRSSNSFPASCCLQVHSKHRRQQQSPHRPAAAPVVCWLMQTTQQSRALLPHSCRMLCCLALFGLLHWLQAALQQWEQQLLHLLLPAAIAPMAGHPAQQQPA
jgi:hypothetical protein